MAVRVIALAAWRPEQRELLPVLALTAQNRMVIGSMGTATGRKATSDFRTPGEEKPPTYGFGTSEGLARARERGLSPHFVLMGP